MAGPLEERTRYRWMALVSGVLLVAFLVDLVTAETHPAVWTLALGLLLSGLALGYGQGARATVGTFVSPVSRRRTGIALGVGLVVVAALGLSRVLGAERSTLQDTLAVVAVAVTSFMLTLSVTVLRGMPAVRRPE